MDKEYYRKRQEEFIDNFYKDRGKYFVGVFFKVLSECGMGSEGNYKFTYVMEYIYRKYFCREISDKEKDVYQLFTADEKEF
ncbi:MAG: hypothetical protein HQL94_07445, partial [Magnetococcales bacterium]|nr:hypothetical protein [Magnetococcales bacterium]